jgi:hypothetical protein
MIQVFVTCHAEHPTVLQLLGKWNNIKVKEPYLTLIPAFAWMLVRSTVQVRLVQLVKQPLVPFDIDVPMLHCMCGTQGLPRHPLLAILLKKKQS